MKILAFTVPGNPAGKGRPRFTRFGRAYTPPKTEHYENLVKLAFRQAYPDWMPTEQPIEIIMRAYFEIPHSWSKKKQEKARQMRILYTKKPDTDNVSKIKDALNGIAYKDDAQVFADHAFEFYADNPHLEIEIIVIEEKDMENGGNQ